MKSNRLFRYQKFMIVICIAVAVFAMLQINAPVVHNPPVTTAISLPEDVSLILKRSCYDCHSNETKLAWYDKIAPVSYLVAKDVKEGRARFNFSQWGDNPPAVQELLLWEMLNAVQQGKMPLKSYSYVHRETLLTGRTEYPERLCQYPSGKT
ncbi:heme-binding domain-containing protein [Pedobacter miscanthi]|nr:heme-binding domain-containing protein [Pedobacter miscanthi]